MPARGADAQELVPVFAREIGDGNELAFLPQKPIWKTRNIGHVDAAARAGRDLREIPSRIASPSTNGPRRSTPEPRAAIGRVTSSFAAETISVMLAVFARVEPALRKSITFDNDTAFAQHSLLRTMRAMHAPTR